MTLDEIISRATLSYQISHEELVSPGRNRRLSEARRAIAIYAHKAGFTWDEIAQALNRTISAVSRMAKSVGWREHKTGACPFCGDKLPITKQQIMEKADRPSMEEIINYAADCAGIDPEKLKGGMGSRPKIDNVKFRIMQRARRHGYQWHDIGKALDAWGTACNDFYNRRKDRE